MARDRGLLRGRNHGRPLGSPAEDDAYLLTFSCDMVNDESHCEIFDAADPTVGPIARVKLPERISSGTHATWAPASQLT